MDISEEEKMDIEQALCITVDHWMRQKQNMCAPSVKVTCQEYADKFQKLLEKVRMM